MSRGELLPLHHVAEGDGVDGVKGPQPGAAHAASPILSLQSSDPYGIQDCVKTMHEARDGPHHAAIKWACVVGPILHLVASPIDFLLFSSYISQKNGMAKSLGPLDVRKVPESQITCKNKEICIALLKPNERGLLRKPLE
jgi:hypothetical protein